jgi:hypothetical protein
MTSPVLLNIKLVGFGAHPNKKIAFDVFLRLPTDKTFKYKSVNFY